MARNDFDWYGEIHDFSNRLRSFFENNIERPAQQSSRATSLPADLTDTGDTVVIEAELPGVQKEEIRLSMAGKAIEIEGEKRVAREPNVRVIQSGRRYGPFRHRIELPHDLEIDLAAASASFENGVLKVVLPKKGGAAGQSIPIE